VEHGAELVGIDAMNIDDTADGERPAHTLLLAAGIPVVEHLTGLEQLPPTGTNRCILDIGLTVGDHPISVRTVFQYGRSSVANSDHLHLPPLRTDLAYVRF